MCLAALGTATLLTACNKPVEKITILANSKSHIIEPFGGVANDLCKQGTTTIGDVSASGGSTILVDVPKKVADGGWFVSSFVVDQSCQLQAVASASSEQVKGKHAIRVSVPNVGTGSFFLQVVPAAGSSDATSKTTWLVRVNLKQ